MEDPDLQDRLELKEVQEMQDQQDQRVLLVL